jgi:hypothetical protein
VVYEFDFRTLIKPRQVSHGRLLMTSGDEDDPPLHLVEYPLSGRESAFSNAKSVKPEKREEPMTARFDATWLGVNSIVEGGISRRSLVASVQEEARTASIAWQLRT